MRCWWQHLLTERLFRTIFDNPNSPAATPSRPKWKRVIDALMIQSFSRAEYLKSLDSFYLAIEAAARTIADFSEKQLF